MPTQPKQRVQLAGREPVLRVKLAFDVLRQREVHVVAAEDQVIADGDAMELCFAVLAAAHSDEREIGRAAADVANENLLSGRYQLVPIRLMLVNPGIEGSLRLFDQHDARQPGK